jgi:hypothetical protein
VKDNPINAAPGPGDPDRPDSQRGTGWQTEMTPVLGSPDLIALGAELTQILLLGDPEQVHQAHICYQDAAVEVVDALDDQRRPQAQIELLARTAYMYLAGGWEERFRYEMGYAIQYAEGIGLAELAAELQLDLLTVTEPEAGERLPVRQFCELVRSAMAEDGLDAADALGYAVTILETAGILHHQPYLDALGQDPVPE